MRRSVEDTGARRLTTLAWAAAVLALLLWLSTTLIAERSVPTLLLTYFFLPQFWLPPAVLLLLVSAYRRNRWAALGSLLALAVDLSLLGWQGHGARSGQADFRLMTYNIARGGAGERPAGQGAAAALAGTILAERPDMICLQEINGLQPELFSELTARLPGYVAVRSREVAILTRFPLLVSHETVLPGTERTLLSAALNVHGKRVTVLDAHFTTVLLRGGWAGARDRREAQMQAVLKEAQQTAGPFIACGDFNTPAHGQVYAALKQGFGNAFEEAGSGFGFTFPARFPLVRIDHVWLRGAHAAAARVPASRASDHRPLVVDVALR
jgi:vancomycin resistance protein VanJ